MQILQWKSPRSAPTAAVNDDAYVRDITGIAFSTHNERVRIEVLTLLCGVSWPIASTLLHYRVSEEYPILDVRALWSLEMFGAYCFGLWEQYVHECQRIAGDARVSVRTLDKALWQYAKEHQPNCHEKTRTDSAVQANALFGICNESDQGARGVYRLHEQYLHRRSFRALLHSGLLREHCSRSSPACDRTHAEHETDLS